MDDDLGTPAAVAAIHDVVREGNKLLAAGDSPALRGTAASVLAMLDVLGLHPEDPAFAGRRGGARPAAHRRPSTASSAPARAAGRRPARPRTSRPPTRSATGSRPPASRSKTPPPARSGHWKQARNPWQATPSARARSRRPARATPPPAPAGACAAGSRAAARRPRPRTARTTRSTRSCNKVDKSAAARPKRRRTGSTDAEWVAGRNSVVEALREGVPVTGLYVAEGAERDNRLREAFQIAADRGVRLLEVSRGELDRMTSGAVHQGLAARIPSYEYAHPDDLLEAAAANGEKPLIVALDSRHRPAQPRRGDPQRGRLRRARRGHPRAPRRRHDRLGLEDQRRRRRPDPGRADGQPGPPAEGLPGRRLHGRRPGRRRRRRAARLRAGRRPAGARGRLRGQRACPAWSARPATSCCRSRWPTSWSP